MAIDYIIASVLILSSIINALALLGFWVTPSLRTTANRFVINLLIVNLVGCAVLIPSLFVCGNSIDKTLIADSLSTKSVIEKIITKNITIENRVECANQTIDGLNCSSWIIEKEKNVFIQEIDESVESNANDENNSYGLQKTRCWGFDLATALGKFNLKQIHLFSWKIYF